MECKDFPNSILTGKTARHSDAYTTKVAKQGIHGMFKHACIHKLYEIYLLKLAVAYH